MSINLLCYIYNISNWVLGISLFLMLVIYPIIFNRKIIPDIERRVNQKLVLLQALLEGRLIYFICPRKLVSLLSPIFYWMDISIYIGVVFFFGKMTKAVKPLFALGKIDYDIKQSTIFEITMCVISFLTYVICILAIVIWGGVTQSRY